MGKRGPLPDPGSARSTEGRNTVRKGATRVECPTPPVHLADRPLAAAFWEAHAPTLAAEGRLRQIHAETFAQLCHLYADVRELGRTIAAEGWIMATEKGQAVSPVARLLRDSRRDFVTLAAKFGLSAADEARLPAAETDDVEDEDDALRAFTGG
jgi:P27 family predicted phage terminase small subunit